jgi:protein-export membrane protein SecD/preprotein translocase SecF subunit
VKIRVIRGLIQKGGNTMKSKFYEITKNKQKLLQGVQGDGFLEKSPPGRRGQNWKIGLILAVIILSIWAATPLKEKIKRGLDLKGGMHLVLQVEVDEAIRLRTDRTVAQLKRLFNEASIEFENISRVGIDAVEIKGFLEKSRETIQDILKEHLPEWDVKDSGFHLRLSLPENIQKVMKDHCIQQSIETIRERVNEYGVNDAGIQRMGIQGEDKILATLPGVDDPGRVKELIKSTAMLEFKHVKAGPFSTKEAALEIYNGTLPDDLMIFPTNPKRMQPAFYVLTAESVITGGDLKSASRGQDGFGAWEVHFSLNPEGAEKLRTYSAANVGKYLSIVFDRKIESVARIDGVLSYHTRITGNYTYDEVNDMVLKLQSGALSASMTSIEERVIGPSLGEDSIKKGITAAVIGLLLIITFMVVYYRAAGVNSVIALFLNILFLMGAMAYFGFTLTLPGIAGIILTIGMAVDANVLIFERIKEEIKNGKSPRSAVDEGFKKAFVTILDANLTTVIAAIFLLQFGAGPIKGFAVTLIIGICASMFTAVFVSRVIFDLVLAGGQKKQPKSSHLKTGENIIFKEQVAIPFMNKRVQWTAFVLSGLIILAGIVTYFSKGFNLGIDFTGGNMIEISFREPVTVENLRASLGRVGLGQSIIQRVDTTGNKFFIKTVEIDHNDSLDKTNQKFLQGGPGGAVFSKSAPPGLDLGEFTILSANIVGPQVGAAMKYKVLMAVSWALLGMFIYIGVRFKWAYGLAAVFTLVHDILVCLTVLLIFNIEISLTVAAALLTIIGYSLNDTIVIFDRVRDNFKKGPSRKPGGKETILNQSINQTLSRTIVTSGTTLAAVLAIFFFGGEVLHDFSFTLLVGIVVGTYSSIFQSCAWLNIIRA